MFIRIEFDQRCLDFSRPVETIVCHTSREIPRAFARLETFLDRGYYLAGFLAYEAGYAFEPEIFGAFKSVFPLMCFGVYPRPDRVPRDAGAHASWTVRDLRTNVMWTQYQGWIRAIKSAIKAGDAYQITICLKLLFSFEGAPSDLYAVLKRTQPVPYPAFIETRDFSIASLSPEMFVKKANTFVMTKPMKGTWPRGKNRADDRCARRALRRSPKNRAENVMIADLLRNDLGRIGTRVRAPVLFEVAAYNTLYQMTSTVVSRVKEDIPLIDIFHAIFPSGSVTGAPKIRAMEIIRALEKEPRRIYTGAIGYITPQRDMFFNIPIRTLLIQDGQGEMGIGGGIVWDSTAKGEWDETRLKARFLTDLCGADSDYRFSWPECAPKRVAAGLPDRVFKAKKSFQMI